MFSFMTIFRWNAEVKMMMGKIVLNAQIITGNFCNFATRIHESVTKFFFRWKITFDQLSGSDWNLFNESEI